MLYAKCLKVTPAWQRATWLNNSNVIAIKPLSIFHNESASILQYSGILATKRQEKSFNENVLIRKWGLWRCYMLDFIKLKHPYRDGLHKLVWEFLNKNLKIPLFIEWKKKKRGKWCCGLLTVVLWICYGSSAFFLPVLDNARDLRMFKPDCANVHVPYFYACVHIWVFL